MPTIYDGEVENQTKIPKEFVKNYFKSSSYSGQQDDIYRRVLKYLDTPLCLQLHLSEV